MVGGRALLVELQQDLNVGLVGVSQLHTVHLDIPEGAKLTVVVLLGQGAHHLVHSGRLAGAWYAGDVHTPGRGKAVFSILNFITSSRC